MDREEKIAELLSKGVKEILPSVDFVKSALTRNKILTIYCGYDPTAPTLHIGHAITLRKLRQFQDLGHKIIFLVGDFTARIGDPTDKSAARTKLSEREIKQNLKRYKEQASKFIRFTGKNSAQIKFNSRWLSKMKFADVLELATNMTVEQMLKRDMFARRMEEGKPIYIHEFMYPLMQGYDSVAMGVDGEVGGNDQLFNMLAGRTLLKNLKNKEKFVITMKLLEDGNGKKMGKSEGNMIALADAPVDMYGKIMSWTDGVLLPAFELCTDYSAQQLAEIEQQLSQGVNPRDIKMRLAYEIVASCVGVKEALVAQEAFIATFQDRQAHDSFKEVAANGRTLETILLEEGVVASKGELRRLVEAGAVTNFDTKERVTLEGVRAVTDGNYKVGKNRFIKIL